MSHSGRSLLALIWATVLAGLSSIVGNVASTQLPANLRPHLWLAWPLFVALLLATVIVAAWQARLEKGAPTGRDVSHPDAEPSVGQVTGYPSSSSRLATLGFQHDPFAFPEAERMPADMLEETFVAHPGFDRYVMDLNRSSVLMASPGSGKTAGRVRLEVALNRRRQRALDGWPLQDGPPNAPLVVTYNDFERVVDRLPAVGLQDHAGLLLAAIADAICSFILAHPDRFMALSDKARDWWWALLEIYLKGESLDSRVQESSLAADWQRTTVRPPPFRSGSPFKSILEGLEEPLATLGLGRLFILVDGVDGYIETQSLPNLEALMAPLLNTLSLLSLSYVAWKFFLPDHLEGMVRGSTGYHTGRLNIVSINWDERSLIELLQLRLKWASDGLIRDIAQLCDTDLLRAVDVEQEFARMALRHRRHGPPRALLELGSQLLR